MKVTPGCDGVVAAVIETIADSGDSPDSDTTEYLKRYVFPDVRPVNVYWLSEMSVSVRKVKPPLAPCKPHFGLRVMTGFW